MTSTTIRVSGPKKLVRRLYKRARRAHRAGIPFMGLFDEARVAKRKGRADLVLRRYGYVPFRTAKHTVDEALDRLAEEKGLTEERGEVEVRPQSPGLFGW